MKKYIQPLVVFLLIPVVSMSGDAWRLRLDREGIRVYSRPTTNSPVNELKGECIVDAPLEVIWQVFLDVDSYTEWVANCRESHKFNCTDTFTCTLHYIIDLPWPVTDRDVVLTSSVKIIDGDNLIASVSVPEKEIMPKRKDCLRMTRMEGRWIFRRLPGNRSHVSMESWADPAGHIPAFVLNYVSVTVPFETLRGLRSAAKKERYIRAAGEFDYDQFLKKNR